MNRIFTFFIIIIAWSCGGDDDGLLDIQTAELRLLSEVVIEDDAELQTYFRTHFYNYEEFDNPPIDFDFEIVIDTIAGDNIDKTPILNRPELIFKDISVSPETFSGLDEDDVIHRLYYLSAREGGGEMPTIADSVFIKFEGFDLNNDIFDTNEQWFDLQGTGALDNTGSFVRGFEEGLTLIRDGNELMENIDGTFRIVDSGIGVIFMPSGLGFFNSLTVGDAYSPVAFKIDLLETNVADHDRDGIPSITENLDNDDDFFNDDTDDNGLPNYLDIDDDGDGILTRDEIEIDAEGNITFPDSDGDSVPDYLDGDS